MRNSKFSWMLSEKCGNGNVSKVGPFFFESADILPTQRYEEREQHDRISQKILVGY